MFKSLFTPVLKSVGRSAVKAATSDTAKSIAKTLGTQVIDSGLNLATDALRGNNLRESANNEFTTIKHTAADSLDKIKRKRKNQGGEGIKMKRKKLKRTVYKVKRKKTRKKVVKSKRKTKTRKIKRKKSKTKKALDFLG